MDDSRAEEPSRSLPIVSAYLVVLLLAVLATIGLMHHAANVFHEAKASGAGFPPEIRRQLVFALVFTGGVAGAVALAAAGEIIATGIRLFRKVPVGRVAGRLAVALSLMVVLVVGQKIANPWLADILRAVRAAGAGTGAEATPGP